jgi:hypothetical protein
MNNQDFGPGLKKIWLRYENMRFVAIFSAILSAFGLVVIRVIPPLGLALQLIAFLAAYYFWWRYFLSRCPKCEHCGLSAGVNPT